MLSEFVEEDEQRRQGIGRITEIISKLSEEELKIKIGKLKDQCQDMIEEVNRNNLQKFDNISKDFHSFKNSMETLKDLQQSLASIKQKLDEKASYQNLRNLEYQLEDYIKKEQFQQLSALVNHKVDYEEYTASTQQINSAQSQIKASKQLIDQQQERSSKIQSSLNEQNENLKNEIKELEENHRKVISELNNKIHGSREYLRNYIKMQEENERSKKIELEQMEQIKEQKHQKVLKAIEGLATREQLRQLRLDILPEVHEQSQRMNLFSKDNEQMKEMIRRFDEVISDKASKMSLHELEIVIEKQYVKLKNWDTLQQQINKTVEKQQETVLHMKDAVKNFESNMSDEINMAVKKNLQKTMANYEKVLSQFSKFFDQEELNKVLERKVDIEYAQALNEMKANKLDVESCVALIDSVHERMKHLAILQVELAKVLIPIKSSSHFQGAETKNSKINRRDFLYKQALLTSSWITDFSVRKCLPGDEEQFPENPSLSFHQGIGGGNKPQAKITKSNITFNDVPSPIREFEKQHWLANTEYKMKSDNSNHLPLSIQRWKHTLSQKMQQQQQKMRDQSTSIQSNTQQNFYDVNGINKEQIGTFLKDRQTLYQNQKLNESQKMSDQNCLKRLRKNYRSVRVSLNSSPSQYQPYEPHNQSYIDPTYNNNSLSARENNEVIQNKNNSSKQEFQIGGQDLLSGSQNFQNNLQIKAIPDLSLYSGKSFQISTHKNEVREIPNQQIEVSIIDKVAQSSKRITIFKNNQSNATQPSIKDKFQNQHNRFRQTQSDTSKIFQNEKKQFTNKLNTSKDRSDNQDLLDLRCNIAQKLDPIILQQQNGISNSSRQQVSNTAMGENIFSNPLNKNNNDSFGQQFNKKSELKNNMKSNYGF